MDFTEKGRGNKSLRLQLALICTYFLAGKRVPVDHPNSQTVSFRITAIIDHLVGMGWPIALDPTLPDKPAYVLVSGPSKLRVPALASDLVTGGKINVQRKIDDSRHMIRYEVKMRPVSVPREPTLSNADILQSLLGAAPRT